MSTFLQPALQALREQFGRLDNQVDKWIGHETGISALLPAIRHGLEDHFLPDSYPVACFSGAIEIYQGLLDSIPAEETAANGYLNLRFYIMLNGFLAACQESLEKASLNESLDPAALVEKSYYKPYFFERVAYSREEIINLLTEDIQQMEDASPDQKGVLLALRIRKGTVLTLTESYCPLHPRLYPLVADLENLPVSKDPALIADTIKALNKILSGI
ncbi:MAG: hypothetical protein ACK2T7_01390 [Anaerolineales bacterium]